MQQCRKISWSLCVQLHDAAHAQSAERGGLLKFSQLLRPGLQAIQVSHVALSRKEAVNGGRRAAPAMQFHHITRERGEPIRHRSRSQR